MGTRGQSPWRSRTTNETEAISLPQPQRGTGNGTLARRDAGGRCGGKQGADKAVAPSAQRRQSKRTRVRRSHGKERGKSASGSAQRRRTLKERSGKECDPRKSRSSPAARKDRPSTLRHAIVTVRPRRQRRLGEANPRRRDRGIERGAALPAGANFHALSAVCQSSSRTKKEVN